MFKWEQGRQQSGYDKLLLLQGKFPVPFDLYILRFKEGSFIKPHVDKVESGKHFRLNIVLKAAKAGGEFVCDNAIINSKRIKFFRPDISEHSVTLLTKGSRYLLSFGFVINAKSVSK